MSGHGTFVAAINCMDGRVQEPVIRWAKAKFGVDYVDMITEAGPDRLLAASDNSSIRERVRISVEKHGSKAIVVAGHYDCAGNPVDKEQHLRDIRKSMERIKSWGFDARVIGIWIDENWQVHELSDLLK